MNQPDSSRSSIPMTPGTSGVSFGHSADGMLVALVGLNAYAMAPGRDGRHYRGQNKNCSKSYAKVERTVNRRL